jgi:hypothetical protein
MVWMADILILVKVFLVLLTKAVKMYVFRGKKMVVIRRYANIVHAGLVLLTFDLIHNYANLLTGPDMVAVDTAVISINSACLGVGLLHLALNTFFHAREYADQAATLSEDRYARRCERAIAALLGERPLSRRVLSSLPLAAFACEGLARLNDGLTTGDAMNLRDAAAHLARSCLLDERTPLLRATFRAEPSLFATFDIDGDGAVSFNDLTGMLLWLYTVFFFF